MMIFYKSNSNYMGKKFKKTVENFTCLVCKQIVVGDGFTDHCPRCLWSKHVDINPGDRLAECCGPMEPISSKIQKEEWKIFYKCQKCGYIHFNKTTPEDNMETVIKISSRPIPT